MDAYIVKNSRSNRSNEGKRWKKIEDAEGMMESWREKSARPWMEKSFPVRSRSADIGWRTSPSTDLLAFNYVLRWLLANCLPLPAHYLSRTTERSCRDALRSKSRLKGNYTIQRFLSVKKKKERSGTLWFRMVPNIYATLRWIQFLATFEGGRLFVKLVAFL